MRTTSSLKSSKQKLMRVVSNVTQSLWGQGVSNNAKAVLLCYNNKKDKSKTDNKTGKIQYNTEKVLENINSLCSSTWC